MGRHLVCVFNVDFEKTYLDWRSVFRTLPNTEDGIIGKIVYGWDESLLN